MLYGLFTLLIVALFLLIANLFNYSGLKNVNGGVV